MTQGDLFHIPENQAKPSSANKLSFLSNIHWTLRLDQTLMGAIVLIVGFVFVYTLGFERGSKHVSAPFSTPIETPVMTVAEPVIETAPVAMTTVEPVSEKASEPVTEPIVEAPKVEKKEPAVDLDPPFHTPKPGAYTLQLVTYKTESASQRQVKKLKSMGLNAFVIRSGSFYQVCVNGFDSRKMASSLLTDLKTRKVAPQDAYIRLIPAV